MCPTQPNDVQGCFLVNTTILDTWDDHEANAQLFGCHLASILNQDEQDVVESLLDNTLSTRLYIGGFRIDFNPSAQNDSLAFNWTDGSTWCYTNFAPDQPNNAADGVVVNLGRGAGRWNDIVRTQDNMAIYKCPNREPLGGVCNVTSP